MGRVSVEITLSHPKTASNNANLITNAEATLTSNPFNNNTDAPQPILKSVWLHTLELLDTHFAAKILL